MVHCFPNHVWPDNPEARVRQPSDGLYEGMDCLVFGGIFHRVFTDPILSTRQKGLRKRRAWASIFGRPDQPLQPVHRNRRGLKVFGQIECCRHSVSLSEFGRASTCCYWQPKNEHPEK